MKTIYPWTVSIFDIVNLIFFWSKIEEMHTDACEADADGAKEVFKLRTGAPCQNTA